VRIDPASQPTDWDVVRRLCRAYQREIGIDLCFQDFESELASLPGCYAGPEGGAWIARRDGEALGMVALRRIPAGCEMKRLYVAPAARGTGLGAALARRCLKEARDRGYRTMLLDTLRSMSAANRLYDALGFAETAAYYENPLPDVRYLRREL